MEKYILIVINLFAKYIFRLIPRNKNIWIFGSWYGERYSDNSRYLFEYINENYKNTIKPIWITKNKEIYNKLKSENKEVYMSNSITGINYMLKCGVCIFSVNESDISNIRLFSGAKIVQLHHGMPLKKILNDDNINIKNNKSFIRRVKEKVIKSYDYNLVTASSDFTRDILSSAFSIDKSKVIITGQARTTYILKNKDNEEIKLKLKKKLGVNIDGKILLYMPTFRRINKNKEKLIKFYNDIYNNNDIKNILEERNMYIVLKKHREDRLNIKNSINNRIILLQDEDVLDSQDLLYIADVLITDYSSVFVDFSILEKPIIFAPIDLDDYINLENGLYFSINELSDSIVYNINELSYEISKLCLNNATKLNKGILDKYYKFNDGNDCERIKLEIEKMINRKDIK